jgi:hypothetical protein
MSPISPYQALFSAGNYPIAKSVGKSYSVSELVTKLRKPLVFFIEGTTSNGRGLLQFIDVFDQTPTKNLRIEYDYLKFLF